MPKAGCRLQLRVPASPNGKSSTNLHSMTELIGPRPQYGPQPLSHCRKFSSIEAGKSHMIGENWSLPMRGRPDCFVLCPLISWFFDLRVSSIAIGNADRTTTV